MSKKIYGIDLGTCMSSIALVDEHEFAQVILNGDNKPLTNSAVWFESENKTLVGELAYENSKVFPDQIELHVKRKMGRLDSNKKSLTVIKSGKEFTPEEVSARILKELVRYAEEASKEPVTDVIITVPAYFGAAECKATMDAGKIAGLTVHETLAEPIAAALAFGFTNPKQEKTLLVYDLGGGTFDITLFKMAPPPIGSKVPKIDMITTGGNHDLGGVNWDEAIRDYVIAEFKTENPNLQKEPTQDASALQTLYLDCERAKKSLARLDKAVIIFQFDGKSCKVELTQKKMLEITQHLLAQTEMHIDLLFATVADRHQKEPDKHPLITPDMVDKVLLAGGSTRLLMVRELLEKRFSGKCDDSMDPDQCVALGAAWYGYLKGKDGTKSGESLPTGVAPHSLGVMAKIVQTGEMRVCPMVIKDSQLPAQYTGDFYAEAASQTKVVIPVYQNDAVSHDDLRSEDESLYLGQVEIPDLPPGRPSGQRIDVTFRFSEGNQLSVKAIDVSSEKAVEGVINVASGMDGKRIAAARKILSGESVSG